MSACFIQVGPRSKQVLHCTNFLPPRESLALRTQQVHPVLGCLCPLTSSLPLLFYILLDPESSLFTFANPFSVQVVVTILLLPQAEHLKNRLLAFSLRRHFSTLFFFNFLKFKTQATWLRANNDTSPVLERLWLEKSTEREKPSDTQLSLPTLHTSKVRKTPSAVANSLSKGWCTALIPGLLTSEQEPTAHNRNDGTPSFRRRHKMFNKN